MTTYAPNGTGGVRAEYAKLCTQSLIENLVSPMPLRLFVADDGSSDQAFIHSIMISASHAWHTAAMRSNSHRGGIGASLNLALKSIDDCWLYTTDDWLLSQRLDLTLAVKLLSIGYDMVRVGAIHPNLRCTTKFSQNIGWWLDIDHQAGGFAFATRPFLASPSLIQKVGWFEEGLNAYETERLFAERVAAISNIRIAFDGSCALGGNWQHIGEYEVGTIQP